MRHLSLAVAITLAAIAPTLSGAQEQKAPAVKTTAKAAAKKKTSKPPPTPAKELFGAVKAPAPMAARSIGFYAKGCLAGATALPVDGPAWQAMRLSRNRNWGHPDLIATVEKLALDARKHDGWPGLLVGDISQPRGGPMLTGHASHQVGLDADIWLTPMPNHRLTQKEREDLSATSMLAADRVSVDPNIWTPAHMRLIKRAASFPRVERLFVHPAIKKALCDATANDKDRSWLDKVRPMWGHYYHFHIRITCPKGSSKCEDQPEPPSNDGCGKELTHWLALVSAPPKPKPPGPPARPKPPMTMDQLPAECRSVLASGGSAPAAAAITKASPAKRQSAAGKSGATK